MDKELIELLETTSGLEEPFKTEVRDMMIMGYNGLKEQGYSPKTIVVAIAMKMDELIPE